MWPWVKRFFTDETAFVGAVRGTILAFGGLALIPAAEMPAWAPDLPSWLGVVAMAGAGMIRAGDKNKNGG